MNAWEEPAFVDLEFGIELWDFRNGHRRIYWIAYKADKIIPNENGTLSFDPPLPRNRWFRASYKMGRALERPMIGVSS